MTNPDIRLPPTIPAKCRKVFQAKVELLPPDGAAVLKAQVGRYLKTIHAQAPKNRNINLELIDRMGAVFDQLLDGYTTFPEEHRALVVGAARYFIETSDANDDLTDPLGFDDDLAVLNTVLMVIGRHDLVLMQDPGQAGRIRSPKG